MTTTPPFRELDTVVMVRDRPDVGLRAGDLGALVHLYAPDAFEVEFVTASGRTQAVVSLTAADVRPVQDDDLLAVRSASTVRGAA